MNDTAKRPPSILSRANISPETYTIQPLDGMRQHIAKRLADTARDIPHFSLVVEVEVDHLSEFRARHNGALGECDAKATFNDLILLASAYALKAVPAANASFTPEGIALHKHADIAIAVALENGLVTPIIRAADTKSLSVLSSEARDLIERARDMKLSPREYKGGTFCISNLSMFGVKQFTSIINEPHGMILSVGTREQRAVVKEGVLTIATMMTLTLNCDHRVVDGAIGAQFLSALKRFMENPETYCE